jgi:hypothetical protein
MARRVPWLACEVHFKRIVCVANGVRAVHRHVRRRARRRARHRVVAHLPFAGEFIQPVRREDVHPGIVRAVGQVSRRVISIAVSLVNPVRSVGLVPDARRHLPNVVIPVIAPIPQGVRQRGPLVPLVVTVTVRIQHAVRVVLQHGRQHSGRTIVSIRDVSAVWNTELLHHHLGRAVIIVREGASRRGERFQASRGIVSVALDPIRSAGLGEIQARSQPVLVTQGHSIAWPRPIFALQETASRVSVAGRPDAVNYAALNPKKLLTERRLL